MIDIQVHGRIENGGFYPHHSELYIEQLKEAGTVENCKLVITGKNKRTLDQNAYFWEVCSIIAARMRQDGWDITKEHVYYRTQENYCKVEKVNPKTGKKKTFTEPLKEQDRKRFAEIIDRVRGTFMQQYPDTRIKTPAQFYGLTESAYDLWKMGTINYGEAKRQSNREE